MTRSWKRIAEGLNLNMPESELEAVQSALEQLDSAFQPLVRSLSPLTEPAFHFKCDPEEQT